MDKTYDLINLDEEEITAIIESLVMVDKERIAFRLAVRAFPDCTYDEVYQSIKEFKIKHNKS